MMYRFEDPQILILLLAIPVFVYVYVRRRRQRSAAIRYSDVESLKRADVRHTSRNRHVLFALRVGALAALVVAFSRPQSGVTSETMNTEGIDIVLAIDVSSSMLAEDLEPNRLEAAKAVAADFVEGRRNDRIGLVVFAGEAFTQVPLTLDYSVVTDLLGQMEVGMIEDGTAVGMGLATAVKRLQASDAESQVVRAWPGCRSTIDSGVAGTSTSKSTSTRPRCRRSRRPRVADISARPTGRASARSTRKSTRSRPRRSKC